LKILAEFARKPWLLSLSESPSDVINNIHPSCTIRIVLDIALVPWKTEDEVRCLGGILWPLGNMRNYKRQYCHPSSERLQEKKY
jgi:hypothetical protein